MGPVIHHAKVQGNGRGSMAQHDISSNIINVGSRPRRKVARQDWPTWYHELHPELFKVIRQQWLILKAQYSDMKADTRRPPQALTDQLKPVS